MRAALCLRTRRTQPCDRSAGHAQLKLGTADEEDGRALEAIAGAGLFGKGGRRFSNRTQLSPSGRSLASEPLREPLLSTRRFASKGKASFVGPSVHQSGQVRLWRRAGARRAQNTPGPVLLAETKILRCPEVEQSSRTCELFSSLPQRRRKLRTGWRMMQSDANHSLMKLV